MKKILFIIVTSLLLTKVVFASVNSEVQTLLPAAQAGNVVAQVKLGYLYGNETVPINNSQSFYWYKKAADQGNAGAMAMVGGYYVKGIGVEKNYKEALLYLNKAKSLSDPVAKDILGTMYQFGVGVHKDIAKAKNLFQASTEANYPPAFFHLGQVYFYGDTGKKDVKKGMALFIKSANLGYAFVQYKLGVFYIKGIGAPQNVPLSYSWYKIASINGYQQADQSYLLTHLNILKAKLPYCLAQGQALVAQKYYQGKAGLQQSNTETFNWLQKAYQTDPLFTIALSLAKAYQAGIGTEKNSQKAFELTKQAAQKPYAPAQQYLANFYMNGIATQKDLVKAYAWLLLAQYTFEHPDTKFYTQYKAPCRPSPNGDALQSSQTVQNQLDQLRSQLNSDQIIKAKSLFETLKQKQAVLKSI